MLKINRVRALFFLLLVAAVSARAETGFVDLLKSLTADKPNVVTEVPALNDLMSATDISSAQKIMIEKKPELAMQEARSLLAENQIQDLLNRKNTTIIIVPGVLGEFIDTRAFEEVFARPSSFKSQWENILNKSKASDERFSLEKMQKIKVGLGDVVNAASIDDKSGRPLLKLVILKTNLGSMESVGTNKEKAEIFNRRVQKYVDLTGDQNIVLLGYSRGTPLALEMVVQAQKKNLPYLSRVNALVSYAGVVFGSALADVTGDANSESGKLLIAAKKLRSELKLSTSLIDRIGKRAHNSKAVADFVYQLAANSKFDADAFLNNARSGDFKTVAALIAKVTTELGIKSLYDFNGHVMRTQRFIDEVIAAVEGLKSENLKAWWQQNTLPAHIKYMSIAASMVDPQNSEVENRIFNSGVGYNNSLDDMSLIGNMRTYKQITGVAMNDSQVAVHQSLFLKNTIAQLNPQNSGLDIRALGILQTHHWGVSLQIVNKMKDGRLNPFPREKVLLALTAYVNQF